MRFMVRFVWQTACQRLSGIIYGTYIRKKLNPDFRAPPGERLSPFLFSSNDFDLKKNAVKFSAFMPPANGRKSVYWTSRLLDQQVWSIGQRFVVPYRGKPIKA